MPISYVDYDLQDGFIHHWLVAGPQTVPVHDLERFAGEDLRQRIAHHYYEEDSGISSPPVERGPLSEGTFRLGDYEGAWACVRCREDHLVDHTGYYPTCHYLRSWAYIQLVSEADQKVTLVLTSHGPADVWLNGQHTWRQEHFSRPCPLSVGFEASLRGGANEILVRFEQVAARKCPHAMALRLCQAAARDAIEREAPDGPQPAAGVHVRLPTTIADVARRNTLERVFEAAYVDRDVFGADTEVIVRWPDDLDTSADAMVRLQTPLGRIYAEAHVQGTAGERARLSYAYQVAEGPYRIILMPRPEEYYERNTRIKREFSVWGLGGNRPSAAPYGTCQERRQEGLINAAQREGNVYSEIAKMALDWWSLVDADVVLQTVEDVNRRLDGSVLYLVGLLGMLHRFGDHSEFPEALRRPLEDCALRFRYWHDEPGSDVMCYTTEGQSILFHACEILAGQLLPDHTFANNGQTGAAHREKGERLALVWLRQRATTGFGDWDSSRSFAHALVALSHLVDLAEAEAVWDMAAVVMDKMLLTIALNSYQGVFGSTQGRAHAAPIDGGLLEPTAGISRLMWGTGTFNHHVEGTVSLACVESYELVPIISDIATLLPAEMWNRERHVATASPCGETAKQEVNKVTYRTPDYMLCSAQDYKAGERGGQQHIWQATLGPGAVVFVTHPPCARLGDGGGVGFWLGNAVLPRVAQWKDVLIAIHSLPEDDWLGFTHACFPAHAFDEHELRDGWAFARKGEGYLALTASQGLSFIEQGQGAYRELRSYGLRNVWLCQMGRATLDGDFETFQRKVLALGVAFDGLSASCETLRGETLSFAWEGSLLRNGQTQPLAGFKHYENPYCIADLPCPEMVVRSGDYLLRLQFGGLEQPEA